MRIRTTWVLVVLYARFAPPDSRTAFAIRGGSCCCSAPWLRFEVTP